MKKETLNALKKSIRHWERLLLGKDVTMSPDACALCKRFNNNFDDESPPCLGCPVFEATEKPYCDGSPYRKAVVAFRQGRPIGRSVILLVWDELQFLRSLLPKKVAK